MVDGDESPEIQALNLSSMSSLSYPDSGTSWFSVASACRCCSLAIRSRVARCTLESSAAARSPIRPSVRRVLSMVDALRERGNYRTTGVVGWLMTGRVRVSGFGFPESQRQSRRSEVGSRKSEVGSRKSEVGSRKSEVGKTGFEFFGD